MKRVRRDRKKTRIERETETTKSEEWFVCPQESHDYIRTRGSMPILAQN